MSRKRFRYQLNPSLNEQEVVDIPDEAAEVIKAMKGEITMDQAKMVTVMERHPALFTKQSMPSFGQAFKKVQNAKRLIESIIKKSNFNQHSK